MTDEQIEYLGERFRAGERTPTLLRAMERALTAVEYGQADAGFGAGLSAAVATLRDAQTR